MTVRCGPRPVDRGWPLLRQNGSLAAIAPAGRPRCPLGHNRATLTQKILCGPSGPDTPTVRPDGPTQSHPDRIRRGPAAAPPGGSAVPGGSCSCCRSSPDVHQPPRARDQRSTAHRHRELGRGTRLPSLRARKGGGGVVVPLRTGSERCAARVSDRRRRQGASCVNRRCTLIASA